MEFLEILVENWIEILSAIGTIAAIFFTRNGKKTAAERQKLKIEKLEKKANKHLDQAKKEINSAEELKKEIKKNA